MRHRTAVKTGRTAAMQLAALHPGSFSQYAAMVERLCDGRLWPRSMRSKVHAVPGVSALRNDLRVANRSSRA